MKIAELRAKLHEDPIFPPCWEDWAASSTEAIDGLMDVIAAQQETIDKLLGESDRRHKTAHEGLKTWEYVSADPIG